MSCAVAKCPGGRGLSVAPGLGRRSRRNWIGWLFDLLMEWRERARQRRALLWLDDRLLTDIGLSLADVGGEAAKPFWRL